MELVNSCAANEDICWHVEWSPDGRQLATCGADKAIRIWALDEGPSSLDQAALLEGVQERTVRRVTWSPDGTLLMVSLAHGCHFISHRMTLLKSSAGKLLASSSFDGTTAVWEHAGGEWECAATLEGHENEVKGVSWSPSGNLLSTCGRDKSVWVWEIRPGQEFECVSVLNEHTQDVKAVAWHSRMDTLISASYDDTIRVWEEDPEGDDWQCTLTLPRAGEEGHGSTVWDVAFEPVEGSQFVSAGDDGRVLAWHSPPRGKWKAAGIVFADGEGPIFSVAWSASNIVCSGGAEGRLRLHAVGSDGFWRQLFCVDAHQGDVNACRFNTKSPSLLASVGDDEQLKVWRLEERR